MSLLILIFYWILLPVFLYGLTLRLLNHSKTKQQKIFIFAASLGLVIWFLWEAVGESWMLEYKVQELCAKDGGVKVYKEIVLPDDNFNEWGQVNFFIPKNGENALGNKYIYKQKLTYLVKGNPSLSKYHVQIYLKNNKLLISESISYMRGGGGLIGPWVVTSFSCPLSHGDIPLLQKTFIKLGREK